MKKLQLILFFVLSFFLFLSATVEQNEKIEEKNKNLIVNSWFSFQDEATKIITFKKDGSFEIVIISIVATDNKNDSEQDLFIKGKWDINLDKLIIEVLDSKLQNSSIWKKDSVIFFKIAEITKNSMRIISMDGVEITFFNKPVGLDAKNTLFAIPFEPFIVNYKQIEDSKYPKFLCVVLKLTLTKPIEIKTKIKLQQIHPRLREAIIFYLSSLHYEDIYSFSKIPKIEKELFELLKPYLKNQFSSVKINEMLILNTKEDVNGFMLRHPPLNRILVRKLEKNKKK